MVNSVRNKQWQTFWVVGGPSQTPQNPPTLTWSLFTNIPLEETIDIATNSLFPNENSSVLGLTPGIFRKLLQFAVKNVLFIFNNKMYQQIDGVNCNGQPLRLHFSELNCFSVIMRLIGYLTVPLNSNPYYIEDTLMTLFYYLEIFPILTNF